MDLASGLIETVFGGEPGIYPWDVGVDTLGNIYVIGTRALDEVGTDYRVWRLDPETGGSEVVAVRDHWAMPPPQWTGDSEIGVGPGGEVYVVDKGDMGLYVLDSESGDFVPYSGTSPGDGAPATEVHIDPVDICIDSSGVLYIADAERIRMVDSTGTMRTVAGGGRLWDGIGDDGPATEAIVEPVSVCVDASGRIVFVQENGLRRIDGSGVVTTIAGSTDCFSCDGFEGDGGPATDALFDRPLDVCADGEGNLYVADSRNNRIRQIDPEGIITTIAGNGERGTFEDCDGAVATEAPIARVQHVWMGGPGKLYFNSEGSGTFLLDLQTGVLDGVSRSFDTYVDPSGAIYRVPDIFETKLIRQDGHTGETTTLIDGGDYDDAPYPGWGCEGEGVDAYLGMYLEMTMDADGNLYIANRWDREFFRGVPGRVMKVSLAPPPLRSTDFDGDGRVNFDDFLEFVGGFGKQLGQEGYESRFDLDDTGRVDFADFLLFVADFGK